MRKSILILATTFAAGLLFVNIYNSLIDAVSWGSNIPASIQVTREYFKVVNPGDFYRFFSPVNQVLTLLGLILCWKADKKIRLYCGMALLFALVSDAFTFGYFYPRNEIMFGSQIETNLDAIKLAWIEWSSMNWLRSGMVMLNVIFDFAALNLLIKKEK